MVGFEVIRYSEAFKRHVIAELDSGGSGIYAFTWDYDAIANRTAIYLTSQHHGARRGTRTPIPVGTGS